MRMYKKAMSVWMGLIILILVIWAVYQFLPNGSEMVDKAFSFLRVGADKIGNVEIGNFTK